MTQKAVAASPLVVGLGASYPLAAILHNQTSLPVVLPGLAEVPPVGDAPVIFRTEAELALAHSNLQHLLKIRDWPEDAVFFSMVTEPEAVADGGGEAATKGGGKGKK